MIRMPPGSRLCSVFHDLHCSKWFIIIAQLDLGKLASLSFYLVHFSFQLLCYNHNLNQNESNACHSTFFLKSCFCYEQLLLIDLHVAGEIELSMMLIIYLHVAVCFCSSCWSTKASSVHLQTDPTTSVHGWRLPVCIIYNYCKKIQWLNCQHLTWFIGISA